ncbi:hypothetical protein OQH61_05250 [Helicobacter sp. MIT 21-1697]|uniref:hypothetical protein n=1 Tax=Helicobacter sp. MIT 21-1697 TaxID=2993733 RepID=UPI00224AC15E|nr:hypothetical protein [Helicobacter sp. MIT 21-1697]MCX2717139.1 hypothetical protein [Helicobacter sp. MIT 21-1697]
MNCINHNDVVAVGSCGKCNVNKSNHSKAHYLVCDIGYWGGFSHFWLLWWLWLCCYGHFGVELCGV